MSRMLPTLALLVASGAANAQNSTPIRLLVNHAEIISLPEIATTLVVGDPTVADVTGIGTPVRTVLVTAKALGTTNFIALNEQNVIVFRSQIDVGRAIRIISGGKVIRTYTCNPNCSPGTGAKEPTLSSLPPGSSVTMPAGTAAPSGQ